MLRQDTLGQVLHTEKQVSSLRGSREVPFQVRASEGFQGGRWFSRQSSVESTEAGYQWFEHGASTKAGTGKGAASSMETRDSLSYWAVGTDLELVVLTERHRTGESGAYQPSVLLLPTATPASIPSPCPRHGHDCSSTSSLLALRHRNTALALSLTSFQWLSTCWASCNYWASLLPFLAPKPHHILG